MEATYHSKDEFVQGNSHINGIDSFWGITKTRLAKRRGIKKTCFYYTSKSVNFDLTIVTKTSMLYSSNLYEIIL